MKPNTGIDHYKNKIIILTNVCACKYATHNVLLICDTIKIVIILSLASEEW